MFQAPPVSAVSAQERRERQKERVNSVARRLLAAGDGGALDASYLLAPGPARPADPAPAPTLAQAQSAPAPAPHTARPPRAARRPRRLPQRASWRCRACHA